MPRSQVKQLLEEIKYKRKFPPRDTAASIKSQLAMRGLGNSSALIEHVTQAYLQVVEDVLDEFADAVTTRAGALGLSTEAELGGVIADAHQHLFNLAVSALFQEFKGNPEYGNRAMARLEDRRGPVWDHLQRAMNLRRLGEATPVLAEEREQKFGILLSPAQAERDFGAWLTEAKKWENPTAMFFVDFDHFRGLNEKLSHTKVDQTILPDAQRLLAKLVQGRGEAYRYGGEEFLLILPNLDVPEATAFAERVRETFERHRFEVDGEVEPVTVSVGVAVWPTHGATYQEVLEAANRAEAEAKRTRNAVRMARAQ